jgi:MFS family permease
MLKRVLGWGILGAICGTLLGCTISAIHVPPSDPSDPLENEWYMLFVLLLIIPAECVAGLVIGTGIALGVHTPRGRRKAFAFAVGGAILGVGLGWVLATVFHVVLVNWNDGSKHMSSLILQAAGVVGGLLVAASSDSVAKSKLRESECAS